MFELSPPMEAKAVAQDGSYPYDTFGKAPRNNSAAELGDGE